MRRKKCGIALITSILQMIDHLGLISPPSGSSVSYIFSIGFFPTPRHYQISQFFISTSDLPRHRIPNHVVCVFCFKTWIQCISFFSFLSLLSLFFLYIRKEFTDISMWESRAWKEIGNDDEEEDAADWLTYGPWVLRDGYGSLSRFLYYTIADFHVFQKIRH